jgi:hypothetical protein
VSIVARMDMKQRHVGSHGRRSKTSKNKRKTKVKLLNPLMSIIAHCNIGINEDLFKTSFDSWRDSWLLDTCATCHMTFWKDFFKELNDNVEGAVYFVDRSSLKPAKIGTIKLKLPGFQDFLLHDVFYLPELRRNLMSIVHIQQQGHSIHMFNRKVEIRRSSNNMVVMTISEDDKLLKLKGTSTQA